MRNVYLDTETTGLKPGQIAQLSMIVEESDTAKFVSAHNYFFEVSSMEEGAEKVHGFSMEALKELSGGVKFSDKHIEINEILKDACIVAHNEAFDERFISSELWRCGISFMPTGRTCTMERFKDIIKIPNKYPKYGKYKKPNLGEVLNFLNISTDKVKEYSCKLFNYDGSAFHDSRFDTTAMYVAVNVYREKLHGGTEWNTTFCS